MISYPSRVCHLQFCCKIRNINPFLFFYFIVFLYFAKRFPSLLVSICSFAGILHLLPATNFFPLFHTHTYIHTHVYLRIFSFTVVYIGTPVFIYRNIDVEICYLMLTSWFSTLFCICLHKFIIQFLFHVIHFLEILHSFEKVSLFF